jgi:hypothetical protein
MSDEEKKPFAVKDRRHFTAEGDARPDAPEAASSEAERPPSVAAAPSPEPEPSARAGEPDLVGLFLSLAAQASALLGMGDDDAGVAAPTVDLAGARGMIGLLEVLERKTKGNRTAEEDQVLDGVLYELRMAYLARAR